MLSELQWKPVLNGCFIVVPFEAIAAACTSACLLGVSVSDLFSILFCVLLFIFAVVFGVLIYVCRDDAFMRKCSIGGVILMPIAAISCVITNFAHISPESAKTPFFMFVGPGILMNFVIILIQILNFIKWADIKNRLLTNNNQVVVLITMNILMGALLGLIFGLLDAENNINQNKMTAVSISFLFVGAIAGFLFVFYNEFQTQKLQKSGLDPAAPSLTAEYEKM